jgi:glycerophosphoryl diester phosphodiesterase
MRSSGRYDVGRLRPGSKYGEPFPAQVAVDGTRIPTLAEVFALARRVGDRRVRFNIETKLSPLTPEQTLGPEPFARKLIEAIRSAGMAGRSTIQSFDWRTLQVAQREAPEIATVYLTSQRRGYDTICPGPLAGNPAIAPADCPDSPWTAGFQLRAHGSVPKLVKAAGGAIWSPNFRDLDAARVTEAHALGLRVIPWTVNEPDDIRAVLALGVDGLISDRPGCCEGTTKINGVRVELGCSRIDAACRIHRDQLNSTLTPFI